MSCFCGSCSIVEWDECELSEWVDTWHRVTLGTDMSLVNEITPLEENQTKISMGYDHISYRVKPGTNCFIKGFHYKFHYSVNFIIITCSSLFNICYVCWV